MWAFAAAVFAAVLPPARAFYVAPSYIPPDATADDTIPSVLTTLAISGLANRGSPSLWLNASSRSWVEGVAVNWPYPQADPTWVAHWQRKLNEPATVLPDAGPCTLLSRVPAAAAAVKGVVLYEDSSTIDALKWVAATAAGLLNAVPVTGAQRSAHPCLSSLPVALELPAASTFATDLDAYAWMVAHLLEPLTSPPPVLVGACRGWKNYTCAWSDPLGTAAIDYAVARRGVVVNLAAADPPQADMLRRIGAFLPAFGVASGWMEPEDVMIDVLSSCDIVFQCGAPNLPFFAARNATPAGLQLPHHRSVSGFNRSKTYLVFQSNEGDTPKNAYSFRGGNWLSPARGSVPIAWGSAPIIAQEFPGLWEYYVDTATEADSFFAATGAVGYTHPWSFGNVTALAQKAGELMRDFMPPGPDNWVDVWEGACPDGGQQNPCMPLYQQFRDASGGRVAGFSQQPTSALAAAFEDWVDGAWTTDGTPVVQQPKSLWYPSDNHVCNATDMAQCVGRHARAAAQGSSRFVLAYGVTGYVDVAATLRASLAAEGIEVIGAQDLAALAWQAGPRGVAAS